MKALSKYPKQQQIDEQFYQRDLDKIAEAWGKNYSVGVQAKGGFWYRVNYVFNNRADLCKMKFEKIGYELADGTYQNRKPKTIIWR